MVNKLQEWKRYELQDFKEQGLFENDFAAV